MSDELVKRVKDRADWLVDAVATATQNRAFLRGEPECDKVACIAIEMNGEKAMLTVAQPLADRIEELEQQVTEYALRSMDQQKQIEGLQKEKLEAVAAAYEDAWDVADAWDYGDDSGPAKVANGIKKDLNSRTPADAQAALEADRKRVREEALREALAKEDRCGFVSREDILALVRQDDSMIEGDKNDD